MKILKLLAESEEFTTEIFLVVRFFLLQKLIYMTLCELWSHFDFCLECL